MARNCALCLFRWNLRGSKPVSLPYVPSYLNKEALAFSENIQAAGFACLASPAEELSPDQGTGAELSPGSCAL